MGVRMIGSHFYKKEWYENWNGDVHVSVGGLDSTVLLDPVNALFAYCPYCGSKRKK